MGVETQRLLSDVVERLAYLQANRPVDWKAIDRLAAVRIEPAAP